MYFGLEPMLTYSTTILPLATIANWREGLSLTLGSLLFVGGVAIAAVIAWAAWNGWPENFDRSMWWTVFMLSVIPSAFFIFVAQRMEPTSTWQNLAQHVLFTLGLLLFFTACGCALAVLTHRRRTAPISD